MNDITEATEAALLSSAQAASMTVSGDQRVSEADAGALLGYAASYMRKMREEGRGPVPYSRGMNGARVSYRLSDIAVWIEQGRNNFE